MSVLKIFYFSFSSVTPAQWESFSNENILKAEKEQNASATLRGVIDEILKETRHDIEQQRTTVNLAFDKRIQETSEAKENLEQHLNKVIEPLFCVTMTWRQCISHWVGSTVAGTQACSHCGVT